MPTNQIDSLFHKPKAKVGFMFGYEADNHAINTVPKETLVKVSLAERGGIGGRGKIDLASHGFAPTKESDFMKEYLDGTLVRTPKPNGKIT